MCFDRSLLVPQGSECESVICVCALRSTLCCVYFDIALTTLGSLVTSFVRLSILEVSWKLLVIAAFVMEAISWVSVFIIIPLIYIFIDIYILIDMC